MRIGPYELDNNLALAPMAGVTDLPFRRLCRRLGAGIAAGEMLSSAAQLWHTPKSRRRMDHRGEAEPRIVQILGAQPRLMAQAAIHNVAAGAQIIDINMGCPAKKVCSKAAGSALMRDEALARAILEAVVAAVDVPVTLKMRTGWDREHRNAPAIARMAEAIGVQALAVHGRTRACRYEGSAEYDTIAQICRAVSIPVFANGDIDSPHKAKFVLEQTGAQGLMIGRGAQGRPWIFQHIDTYLRTGSVPAPPTPGAVRDIMLAHLQDLHAFYGDSAGVRVARKHFDWYTKGRADTHALRHAVMRAQDAPGQLACMRMYFDALAQEPAMQIHRGAAADEW